MNPGRFKQTLDYDFALEESVYEFLGPMVRGRVSLQGVVTAKGDPVLGARVELVGRLGTLALVSTDSEGGYEIPEIRIHPRECSGLTLIITHPDKRHARTILVPCGEQRLDYDFPERLKPPTV